MIGIDPHQQTHTAVAIRAGSGEVLGELTAAARVPGYEALRAWSHELDVESVWALEDCRHVSRGLERFLRRHGERVVRVPPKLMGHTRRSARTFGKSDSIDALADPHLPSATEDVAAEELRLLTEHRVHHIRERTAAQDRLRWHLHDVWPEAQIPAGGLDREKWLQYLSRKLARSGAGVRVRIMRAHQPGPAPDPRGHHARARDRNRSLNAALHKIAVVQGRVDERARAFLARKQAEGKTRREALRALKRLLARRIFALLRQPVAASELPVKVKTRRGNFRVLSHTV